jgi:Galactose mutarotase and related enzymes
MSGSEVAITAGGYRARVVTVGAGLAGLTLEGHDLVLPHSVDEVPQAWKGKVLLPWPNRITEGRYTWQGKHLEVPVNEHETGAALHGLMGWVEWDVVESAADRVALEAFVAPRYGYPWTLLARASYALDAATGLRVDISATNEGTSTAPYGSSSHPFLTLDHALVDGCELTVPAARVLEVDEVLAPLAVRDVASLGLDLRSPALVGGRSIDHAFTGLPEGDWTVTLREPSTGARVAITSDAPWLQVYSGELVGRQGVAVEPMTCAPDAFNSGMGLVELGPGQTHTLTYTVTGSLGNPPTALP